MQDTHKLETLDESCYPDGVLTYKTDSNTSYLALSVGGDDDSVGGGGAASQVEADRALNRVERAGRVGAATGVPDEGLEPPGLPPLTPDE